MAQEQKSTVNKSPMERFDHLLLSRKVEINNNVSTEYDIHRLEEPNPSRIHQIHLGECDRFSNRIVDSMTLFLADKITIDICLRSRPERCSIIDAPASDLNDPMAYVRSQDIHIPIPEFRLVQN